MKWFDNLKIRYKLFIVFGMLVCIAGSFAVYAVTAMRSEGEQLSEQINSYQERQIHVADAIADVYRIQLSNYSRWFLAESGGQTDGRAKLDLDYEEFIRQFNKNIFSYRSLVLADRNFSEAQVRQRIDLVDRIQALFDNYVILTRELSDAVGNAGDKQQMFDILDASLAVEDELSNIVQELRDLVFLTARQSVAETLESSYQRNNDVLFVSIAFILFSILTLLFTIRSIDRPISDMHKAVNEIANGDLSYPIHNDRRDEFGSLADCIGDMVDKISEQNRNLERMHEEAQAQADQIQEAHRRAVLMMDSTPMCSMLWDKDARIFDCNEQSVRLFGTRDKQEFIERFFEFSPEYQPGGEHSREKALAYVQKTFEEGKCVFEWMHRTLGGEELPCEMTLVRVMYSEDYIVAAYARDLREHRRMMEGTVQLQAELKEALQEAQDSNQAKSRFLATMSHEIRTPMNAILGTTEIQLRDDGLSPELKEALVTIYNSGDLLLSIINDILDLSKIEAGKLEISPGKYETASLINDTVTLNMMRIGSKPIKFALAVDENLPTTLIGDDLRIKQILNNLLSNAFKYTAKGTVKFSISLEEGGGGAGGVSLKYSVTDTGQGMTAEQIANLFDEYSRFNTEANRTTEGTGLGMSITRSLVEMMGGSIAVESVVDQGSTFTVILPQGIADAKVLGRELANSLQNLKLDVAKQFRKAQIVYEPMPYGRVLIVDDVESNLYVARGLLAPYGLSVTTVVNGFQAIDKIKEGNMYDIVFMDHMMPIMDGIEAAGKMRELGYVQPIVALTANAVAGQADIFLSNGFDDFISKPIDMRQLASMLKKYVRDKQPPEVLEATRRLVDVLNRRRAEEAEPAVEKEPIDPQLAEYFIRDASRAVDVLDDIHKKHGDYQEEDIKLFTTTVHAMKSALGNVGEAALSNDAAMLEKAGRDKDMAVILLETPPFLTELRARIAKLSPASGRGKGADLGTMTLIDNIFGDNGLSNDDLPYLNEKLLILKDACASYDRKTQKAIISELREKAWPRPIQDSLSSVSELLLNGDMDEVTGIVDTIIQMTNR